MYRIDVTDKNGELLRQRSIIDDENEAWDAFDNEIRACKKGDTVTLFDTSSGYDDLVDSHVR